MNLHLTTNVYSSTDEITKFTVWMKDGLKIYVYKLDLIQPTKSACKVKISPTSKHIFTLKVGFERLSWIQPIF
jgi:hypothetical protein